MQFNAASVIGQSWPGSDEGSIDDSFCTALGSGSDADAADVVIVAELQFFCAIIVGFTPAQHGRAGTHIAQAMPRDARLRAPFSTFEQCARVAPSSSFALASCGPNPFLKISTVSCTSGRLQPRGGTAPG